MGERVERCGDCNCFPYNVSVCVERHHGDPGMVKPKDCNAFVPLLDPLQETPKEALYPMCGECHHFPENAKCCQDHRHGESDPGSTAKDCRSFRRVIEPLETPEATKPLYPMCGECHLYEEHLITCIGFRSELKRPKVCIGFIKKEPETLTVSLDSSPAVLRAACVRMAEQIHIGEKANTHLVEEVERLKATKWLSPYEHCHEEKVQNCHICEDMDCGDNRSPAKRLLTQQKDEIDALKHQIDDQFHPECYYHYPHNLPAGDGRCWKVPHLVLKCKGPERCPDHLSPMAKCCQLQSEIDALALECDKAQRERVDSITRYDETSLRCKRLLDENGELKNGDFLKNRVAALEKNVEHWQTIAEQKDKPCYPWVCKKHSLLISYHHSGPEPACPACAEIAQLRGVPKSDLDLISRCRYKIPVNIKTEPGSLVERFPKYLCPQGPCDLGREFVGFHLDPSTNNYVPYCKTKGNQVGSNDVDPPPDMFGRKRIFAPILPRNKAKWLNVLPNGLMVYETLNPQNGRKERFVFTDDGRRQIIGYDDPEPAGQVGSDDQ